MGLTHVLGLRPPSSIGTPVVDTPPAQREGDFKAGGIYLARQAGEVAPADVPARRPDVPAIQPPKLPEWEVDGWAENDVPIKNADKRVIRGIAAAMLGYLSSGAGATQGATRRATS